MKIVILGGGFGGVYTLKYLHKFFHNKKKVKLVLVNKKNYFIFTPLLHEIATGGVSIDNALEPIREIIKCCDFDFIHGAVEKIDLENRVVYVNKEQTRTYTDYTRTYTDKNVTQKNAELTQNSQKHTKQTQTNADYNTQKSVELTQNLRNDKKKQIYKIDYDYLVIALGSKTNYYNIPGAKEYSYSLKTIDDAIRLKNHFVHLFELSNLIQNKAELTQNLQKNNQAELTELTQNLQKNSASSALVQRSSASENNSASSALVQGSSASENNSASSALVQGSSELKKYLTFVIVGGGATGVEIAGEMSDLFYKTFSKLYPPALISKVKIILVEKGKELIPQFSPKLRQKALERLRKLKVDVSLEKGVIEVGEDFIKLDDGSIIETKTVIWTAGVEPNLPEIIGNIEKDNKGRLIVNEYLQVKKKINAETAELTQNLQNLQNNSASSASNSASSASNSASSASNSASSAYNNVFALGDICCFIQNEKPLPQLAQVAVRQAKTVALNIRNLIEGKPLKKFIYKHTGDLISVGRFYALGEIKGIEFSGLISWLIWKAVYLSKMISFRDQVKTFIDWILNLFLPRDITEL